MKSAAHFATFATLCLCWLSALTFKPGVKIVCFLAAVSAAGLLTFALIRESD